MEGNNSIKHQIKNQIKNQKKKKIEINSDFYNKMASFCACNNIHTATLYKVMKVKGMQQMLDTMRDEAISEYELHVPTLDKLNELKTIINEELERKGLRERL